MSMRYLGFVLLVWIPVLRAQTAAQSCGPPTLNNGYFVPDEEIYHHGAPLTYACDEGLKPAVEGWWASSKCENGKWVHEPQCIDKQDCILPTIPNGQNTNNSTLLKNGDILQIKCNEGYERKNSNTTARCEDGQWSSLPICQKNASACGQPPKVPHAVILQQEYQDVFPANTEVLYLCKEGYAIGGINASKSIFCKNGTWDERPKCSFCKPPCKDTHCSVDTTKHPDLVADGVQHIRSGYEMELKCVKKHWYWLSDHYSLVECIRGRVIVGTCRGFTGRTVAKILDELELETW